MLLNNRTCATPMALVEGHASEDAYLANVCVSVHACVFMLWFIFNIVNITREFVRIILWNTHTHTLPLSALERILNEV